MGVLTPGLLTAYVYVDTIGTRWVGQPAWAYRYPYRAGRIGACYQVRYPTSGS